MGLELHKSLATNNNFSTSDKYSYASWNEKDGEEIAPKAASAAAEWNSIMKSFQIVQKIL